jgi:hypothetical protein
MKPGDEHPKNNSANNTHERLLLTPNSGCEPNPTHCDIGRPNGRRLSRTT